MKSETVSVRPYAPESDRVRKTREKLIARLNAQDLLVTGKTLQDTKEKIQSQFSRSASSRERVEDKPFGKVFSQGVGVQNAGPKVTAIMERVQKEFDLQQEVLKQHFPPMTIKPLETDS